MIKAPVIHIDSTDGRRIPITQHLLRMQKARGIFINPHTLTHQSGIIGSGHTVNDFFIRNTRGKYPYIHATFCRQSQLSRHLITDDQIRSCHIEAFLRRLDQVQVDILTHRLSVQWRIRIGLYIAGCLLHISIFRTFLRCLQILFIIGIRLSHNIPHFQKHHGKILYRSAGQLHTGILPVAVRMRDIKILICQIISTGESYFSVDDHDLTMVAVIHENI